MSAIERLFKVPESTAVELVHQRYDLQSLNDRVDGHRAMDRIEIGAVVAYGTMGCAARVYEAVEGFEKRAPAGGDTFRRIADGWSLGAEGELYRYFRGGER